jgi:transposase
MTWRHLDFFQHHCFLTARVPRVSCSEHGFSRVTVPWARSGSGFTVLFEQAILSLAREMPVNAIAEFVGITDKRIWRILKHYVNSAMQTIDLKDLVAVAIDETASKRRHKYVTVFLDMDRYERPVVFAVPGKGKECISQFSQHLAAHGGSSENVLEVVCDMSPSFTHGAEETFPNAAVTVDWFHVVKLFTDSVDKVRRLESREESLPKGTRFAVLKNEESPKTQEQVDALKELEKRGLCTATAYRIKELLRFVRSADTNSEARRFIQIFCKYSRLVIGEEKLLKPVLKAVETVERHCEHIVRRWNSLLTNARLESFNGLFQAARRRARGFKNQETFCLMIYLIGAPISKLLWPQNP